MHEVYPALSSAPTSGVARRPVLCLVGAIAVTGSHDVQCLASHLQATWLTAFFSDS